MYHYVDTAKTGDRSLTHRDVLLDLLIGQRDDGAVVRWRWRQAEAVSDGTFRLSQRLLEVLDVPLSRHLQLLCLATHCRLAHYEDNNDTDIMKENEFPKAAEEPARGGSGQLTQRCCNGDLKKFALYIIIE